jgi:hypothetical protein
MFEDEQIYAEIDGLLGVNDFLSQETEVAHVG